MVLKAMQLLATSSVCIFVKRGTIAYQKLKLLQFPPLPLMCFMFAISRDFYNQSFYELTMRYSIFLKINLSRAFPLSFSSVEQQCQMKLHDVMNQSLRERRSPWDQ
jgi:hypothetical protein